MKAFAVRRVIVGTVIVAAVSFWNTPAASTAAPQSSAEASKPVAAAFPEGEYVAFIARIQAELNQGHFAALDETAEELLRTKARFPGGNWKLYHFHDALAWPVGKDKSYTDQAWEQHIATLQLWKSQRKKSASALIALGESWTNYGWKSRGYGYRETVTDDKYRVFQQRLTVAAQTLDDAGELAASNPHWYWALLGVAQGQGWDRSKVEAVFDDGIKVEPSYQPLYSAVAIYLMPRWYGEEGDWERFADAATTRVGGREGAAIYSHIIFRVSAIYGVRKFFAENTVSWPRIRQAIADREALYGTNRYIVNMSCQLAGAALDKPTTRALLARIGESWDPEVWKERKFFDGYRTWAEQ